jgi:hypothetical protein
MRQARLWREEGVTAPRWRGDQIGDAIGRTEAGRQAGDSAFFGSDLTSETKHEPHEKPNAHDRDKHVARMGQVSGEIREPEESE